MQEKRRDKRMELESQLIIKRLDSENPNESKVNISIKDVSKGGLGFTCEYALTVGSVYEMVLTIWTKETIHAFVEIVRVIKRDNRFEYGGIFIGMPEIDMKRIEIYSTFRDAEMEENS